MFGHIVHKNISLIIQKSEIQRQKTYVIALYVTDLKETQYIKETIKCQTKMVIVTFWPMHKMTSGRNLMIVATYKDKKETYFCVIISWGYIFFQEKV